MKTSNLFFLIPVVLGLSTAGPLHAQVCDDTSPPPVTRTPTNTCGAAGNQSCIGTNGKDTITGSFGWNNVIVGRKDKDTITGGDNIFRFDAVCAGDGKDNVRTRAGNDHLMGGEGKDTLDGGPGIDYMDGGHGNDTCMSDHPLDRKVSC